MADFISESQANLSDQRAAFHFFGLVFLLAALLAIVIFVDHWRRVDILTGEVIRLRKEVSALRDQVKDLELRVETSQLLDRAGAGK